jgi:O-antigen ligase
MTAGAEFPIRVVPALLAVLALLLGFLAGAEPEIAVVGALCVAFVALAMSNLTVGVCLFAVLSFLDTLFPTGGVVSGPKLLGLLLVLSWLALVTTGSTQERARVFDHPAFLGVLAAFIGWVAISAAWSEETAPVIESVIRYVPNAMLFLIVFAAIRTREQALWLVGAFVVGALVSAAYGLAVPTDPAADGRLSGGVGNANETAAALVAGTALAGALVAALRGQPLLRLGALIAVPFCLVGILLTLSRGGLVALAAALVAAVVVAGRWRPLAIAVVATAGVMVVGYFVALAPPEARERVTTIQGGTGREDIWKVGWRMVEAEPVRGIGAGNFPNTSVHYLLEPGVIARSDFIVDTPKVAHNMYLEVLAENGVIGLALFLTILGFSLTCCLRAVREFRDAGDRELEIVARALFVALVGLLAANFFGSHMFSKQLWLLLSLAPALLAIGRREREESPAPAEGRRG